MIHGHTALGGAQIVMARVCHRNELVPGHGLGYFLVRGAPAQMPPTVQRRADEDRHSRHDLSALA